MYREERSQADAGLPCCGCLRHLALIPPTGACSGCASACRRSSRPSGGVCSSPAASDSRSCTTSSKPPWGGRIRTGGVAGVLAAATAHVQHPVGRLDGGRRLERAVVAGDGPVEVLGVLGPVGAFGAVPGGQLLGVGGI